jgi:hypothetical protein
MDFPIYYAQADDEAGLTFVSLVDKPAIERDFLAFNAAAKPFRFEVQNEEKRIITGAAMIADLPIYRKDDSRGEYYIIFTADTIFQLAKKFAREGKYSSVNLQHESETTGVHLLESYFVNRERGITPPKGFDEVADGSWFMTYVVDNDEVWGKVKSGEFKGFSVEGAFGLQPSDEMAKILADIESLREEIRNFNITN